MKYDADERVCTCTLEGPAPYYTGRGRRILQGFARIGRVRCGRLPTLYFQTQPN